MSCKEIIQIDSPWWSNYNFYLIFYGDQGWNDRSGCQIHLTTALKDRVPNFMYDTHIMNYCWEWLEFVNFLQYTLETPDEMFILKKIERQKGAFTTEKKSEKHVTSRQGGVKIELDFAQCTVTYLSPSIIESIVSQSHRVSQLFKNGISNDKCNCFLYTSPFYIGPCLAEIRDPLNAECIHCRNSSWCCDEYVVNQRTCNDVFNPFWRFELVPEHAHHNHPHCLDWSPTSPLFHLSN